MLALAEKKALSLRALRDAKEAVDFRRRTLSSAFRKAVNRRIALKLDKATERELTEALIPFFVEQGRSMAKRLEGMSKNVLELEEKSIKASNPAATLVRKLLDPEDWREDLTNRVLPVLARRMGEAAVAHLMSLGIDPRKKGKRTKASTAAEWIEEQSEEWETLEEAFIASGVRIGVLAELPQSMKDKIAERLAESFSQDYWDKISKTTMGNAETVLRRGLDEGWSIHDMAVELREYFEEGGFRYARARSENIARTESGNTLNGARKDSVARLQEGLGDRVPIKQSWLSVLGNTTRAEHADLDGVPEDENGMWNLAGYDVPWPRHFDLPAEQRCNCFPAGVLVSGDFIGAQRAWYEGKFIEIVTGNGTRLSLTVNHPVVTSKGLVSAGMIEPGDKVVTYGSEVDSLEGLSGGGKEFSVAGIERVDLLSFGGYDIQDEPFSIEQIFETLTMVAGVEGIRASIGDFYGDGGSVQSDIDIVRTDGILPEHIKSMIVEKADDSHLGFAGSSRGSSPELRHSSFGSSFEGVSLSPSHLPSFSEKLFRKFRFVFGVSPSCSLAVGVAADFDVSLSESVGKDGPAVSSFLRESLKRYAGLVSFDEVVEVRHFHSAGHVYDLQSRHGLIVASDPLYTGNGDVSRGIVVSNCQCSLTIEFGMREDEAQQLIEDYWERVEGYEGEALFDVWSKHLPGRHDQGTHGRKEKDDGFREDVRGEDEE